MFGKKTPANDEKKFAVTTIPQEFYGGKDPVIFPIHAAPKTSSPEKKKLAPETAAPRASPAAAENHKMQMQKMPQMEKPKRLLILLIIVVLLGIAGIVFYYLYQTGIFAQPAEQTVQREVREKKTIPVITPTSTPQETPTTTEEEEPIEVPRTVTALRFPEQNFVSATDIDSDQLTDVEEEVFGTDSGTWDSDKDGYYDGLEVVNLYNPNGTAPMRLVDSGFVREYSNPLWQYRMYYPTAWQVDAVDNESRQVLVSAISGEYIEARIMQKAEDQTFLSWFAEFGQGEQITDYQEIENRFDVPLWRRQDGLVAFVGATSSVYALIYHPDPDSLLFYPRVMEMLIQSFRPSRVAPALPEQVVFPAFPSTTASTTTGAL